MADSSMKDILMLGLVAVGGYFLYEWLFATPTGVVTSTPTPGTTPTQQQQGQGTSVTTSPSSTPQTATLMQTLADNMAATANMQMANADQWNTVLRQITGWGVDNKGVNFDAVYGPVVSGARQSGNMSAMLFLQLAAGSLKGGLPGLGGLGAIANYAGRMISTTGNMLYAAHHPLPYTPSYNLRGFRGLGAYTQATGFEKALLAGARIQRRVY